MALNHGPPFFPQSPTSTLAAVSPLPGVAGGFLSKKTPAQGSGDPFQDPRLRITPSRTLPCPYFPPRNLSGPPSVDPSVPAFFRPQPTFPTPQGEVTPARPAPATHVDPWLPRRHLTDPIPGARVPPGLYTSYASQQIFYGSRPEAIQIHPDRQRDQDNSDYEEDGDTDGSTLYDGGTLPKSPITGIPKRRERHREQNQAHTSTNPSLPATGSNGPVNGPPGGSRISFLARMRIKFGKRRRQGPATTAQLPQPPAAVDCRMCQNPLTPESASQFGGFCCEGDMWSAILRGVATRCPRCLVRACPEGQVFCTSPSCVSVRH